MAVQVEQLTGEPIVIATYEGHITPGDVLKAFEITARIIEEVGGQVYRLTYIDTDTLAISFDEVLRITVISARGTPGSTTDPQVIPVMVGEHPYIDLYVEAMRQKPFGEVHMPVFPTLDTALIYVRGRIRGNASSAGH